jgi:hypothetical protein
MTCSARAETAPHARPSGLLETYDTMDGMCRQEGSPVTQATSCAERDKLYVIIKAQGWCKGRSGQTGPDRRWQPCGPKSL